MKLSDRILTRKIGAFEVLVALVAFHAFTLSFGRALLCAVAAGLFLFAKREFGGEFSLSELFALFSDNQPKDPKT